MLTLIQVSCQLYNWYLVTYDNYVTWIESFQYYALLCIKTVIAQIIVATRYILFGNGGPRVSPVLTHQSPKLVQQMNLRAVIPHFQASLCFLKMMVCAILPAKGWLGIEEELLGGWARAGRSQNHFQNYRHGIYGQVINRQPGGREGELWPKQNWLRR